MASTKKIFTCVVPCCRQRSANSDMKFYQFPSNPKRRSLWINSIGLTAEDLKYKFNYVCQRHFRKENIGVHYLTRNAVPVLNLSKDYSHNEEFCNIQTSKADHNLEINDRKSYELNEESHSVTTSQAVDKMDIDDMSDSSAFCQVRSEDLIKDKQTNPLDENAELLKLMNSIICSHCEIKNEDKECYGKCKKNWKDYFIYKKKLMDAKIKIKQLTAKNRKLARNFNNLKTKYNKIKNSTIDEMIDTLTSANDPTKSVCKLLLKEDYYYTESDKTFAQCLYYKSATTYKFLKTVFQLKLPSISSIYKWSPISFISPGTNYILMNQLKHLFQNMTESSRICVLSFDEITIKKDLTVNLLTDKVDGYCDTGDHRSNELATSAVFFMLRGLVGSWKYVLNYILINNSISVEQLAQLIIKNIKLCQETLNLNIVMVTCDQGTTNVAVYKHFGVSPEKPYITVNGKNIFVQYDPPHLMKSVRNAFIKHNFLHSDYGTSNFNVVKLLYEHEKNQKVKLLPKLSKNHMEPNNFQKMSVKLAVQVLSNSVACAIRATLKSTPSMFQNYMEYVIPTANIIERFNNIFDCLNCRNFSSKNPFEQPLKVNNNIYIYLEQSLEFLKNLKILSKNENYFKFLKGLELTICAQLGLINYLNSNFAVDFILTGKTNQDVLENFFSALRGKGGFNYMPSSYDIGVHFANIVVMKVLFHSIHSNCLPDDSLNLKLDWKAFKDDYNTSIKYRETEETSSSEEIDSLINEAAFSDLTSNAISYYAGYCVYTKIDCDKCQTQLLKSDAEINANDLFIHEKNFKKDSCNFGSLKAPSDELFHISQFLVEIFQRYFNQKSHTNNICEAMTIYSLEKIKLKFPSFLPEEKEPCFDHLKKLISFFLLVLLRRNCKWSVANKVQHKNMKEKAKHYTTTKASKRLKILSN